MQTALTISLCVVAWLYTICVMKNGGGFVSTVAIVGAAVTAFAGAAWFLSQDAMLYAWLAILTIPAAFLMVIFDSNSSDGGLVN